MKRQDVKRNQPVQLLTPGTYIPNSVQYVKEFGDVGHIVEFKVPFVYACFEREDHILLEGPEKMRNRVLILNKIHEGDILHIRGLVLTENN